MSVLVTHSVPPPFHPVPDHFQLPAPAAGAYIQASGAENLLQKEAIIIDRLYDEQITFIYQSETDLAPQFQEITNGQYAPVFQETLIVEKELVQEN